MTQSLREQTVEEVERRAVDAVSSWLESEGAEATLEWAFDRYGNRLGIATGFGPEGIVLMDLAARISSTPNIFFIDTGFHFPETLDLRRRIEDRYGVAIEALTPYLTPEEQGDVYGTRLWEYDPDFCCSLRKLEPLESKLATLRAWATGIRRDQTAERAEARVVEWDARWGLVKVNPLAAWRREQVWQYITRRGLPYNPLHDRGYPSVGCTHCTRSVADSEPERAGRWTGFAKSECGLHTRPKGRE